jgi:hypothetical protein
MGWVLPIDKIFVESGIRGLIELDCGPGKRKVPRLRSG